MLSALAAIGERRGQRLEIPLRNGHRILVSPAEGRIVNQTVGMTCLRDREFEPRVERTINDLLEPGDTAVDIGANVGYMTLVMARRVGERGRVTAFEPAPDNLALLERNMALNDYGDRAQVIGAAVGDQAGTLDLSFDPRLPGNASFHYAETNAARTVEVPVVTLDETLPGQAPRLIKIDVQGHEMAVFRGAENTIRSARPALIFEYDPKGARRAGWTLQHAVALLSEWAPYRFSRLDDEGGLPLDSFDEMSGAEFGDVLAVVSD